MITKTERTALRALAEAVTLIVEYGDEIKAQLFEWASKELIRGVNRGLAEYYKEKLFKSQFEDKT